MYAFSSVGKNFMTPWPNSEQLYTVSQNMPPNFCSYFCYLLINLQNSSTATLRGKFAMKISLTISPHSRRVATLPCDEISSFGSRCIVTNGTRRWDGDDTRYNEYLWTWQCDILVMRYHQQRHGIQSPCTEWRFIVRRYIPQSTICHTVINRPNEWVITDEWRRRAMQYSTSTSIESAIREYSSLVHIQRNARNATDATWRTLRASPASFASNKYARASRCVRYVGWKLCFTVTVIYQSIWLEPKLQLLRFTVDSL